jgi:hypothetical protein
MKAAAATTFDPFAESLGISFVPVSRQTKRPYHENWTQRDDLVFGSNDNVGGRWGDKSGGLVDIDCDIPQAARVSRDLLSKQVHGGAANRTRAATTWSAHPERRPVRS